MWKLGRPSEATYWGAPLAINGVELAVGEYDSQFPFARHVHRIFVLDIAELDALAQAFPAPP